MISKENKEKLTDSMNFPKEPPKIRPTIKQLESAATKAAKEFIEEDLPEIREKYPLADGDTLKITFPPPGHCD